MAEKKKTEEKKEEAKIYTIPLRDAFSAPRKKRTRKAVKIVSAYLKRHLKTEDVKISGKLNETLWVRGIEKPPRKIRVKVSDIDGVLTADTLE